VSLVVMRHRSAPARLQRLSGREPRREIDKSATTRQRVRGCERGEGGGDPPLPAAA
jgi:hypothetical protein